MVNGSEGEVITIFACPKPFNDPHIAMIQRNAIKSWLLLRPAPRIMLFGGELGVAELCLELGLEHYAEVSRSAQGTPLLSSVFAEAEARSNSALLCYANADILLMSDFMRAVKAAQSQSQQFMLGLRPWNLDVNSPLVYHQDWEDEIKSRVGNLGDLRNQWSCDVFLYRRGTWGDLPPYVLGRVGFDNALMRLVREKNGILIDGTPGVMAVHQNHSYARHLQGEKYFMNDEGVHNIELAGGVDALFGWQNASHFFDGERIRRDWRKLFVSRPKYVDYKLRSCRLFYNDIWYPALRITKPVRAALGLSSKPNEAMK